MAVTPRYERHTQDRFVALLTDPGLPGCLGYCYLRGWSAHEGNEPPRESPRLRGLRQAPMA